MSVSFFSKINYSACNEDSNSERHALQLTPTDTVLCITGSGARPLDLLIDRPARMVSVDFNPTQNYLLELKMAAYQTLNYADFLAFLGCTPASNRTSLYQKLASLLSVQAKAYWDSQQGVIASGVLYAGTWERLLQRMAQMAFFRRKKVHTLMQLPDLNEQRDHWNRHWDTPVWRLFLKILSNRFLWTRIIREPGALLIPSHFDVYAYMHSRLNHLAHTHVLRENPFAHLLFLGHYLPAGPLPLHLQEVHFETIRSQLHTLEIVTDSLTNVLADVQRVGAITAYSLSDFSSYADEAMYTHIWTQIATHAQPGTRFCERQFLVKRTPEAFHPAIDRNQALEAFLTIHDQTAIYSFCAGMLRGS